MQFIYIQLAVDQCENFTHFTKRSHAMGMNRICRYLTGAIDKGLMYIPDKDMKRNCYIDANFTELWGAEDGQSPLAVKLRTGYVLKLVKFPFV